MKPKGVAPLMTIPPFDNTTTKQHFIMRVWATSTHFEPSTLHLDNLKSIMQHKTILDYG